MEEEKLEKEHNQQLEVEGVTKSEMEEMLERERERFKI